MMNNKLKDNNATLQLEVDKLLNELSVNQERLELLVNQLNNKIKKEVEVIEY